MTGNDSSGSLRLLRGCTFLWPYFCLSSCGLFIYSSIFVENVQTPVRVVMIQSEFTHSHGVFN